MAEKFKAAEDVRDASLMIVAGDELTLATTEAIDDIYAKVPTYLQEKAKFSDSDDLAYIQARVDALVSDIQSKIDSWTAEERALVGGIVDSLDFS